MPCTLFGHKGSYPGLRGVGRALQGQQLGIRAYICAQHTCFRALLAPRLHRMGSVHQRMGSISCLESGRCSASQHKPCRPTFYKLRAALRLGC